MRTSTWRKMESAEWMTAQEPNGTGSQEARGHV